VNTESIILGQGGTFNIHYDTNFTPSKHVCVLQHKNNNYYELKYIYYIIPELRKHLITNGSVMGWLNKTNIKDLDMPIPKSQIKIKEWVDKISSVNNEELYKQYIQEMVQDAIPSQINDIDTHTIPLIENVIEMSDDIEIVPKKKVIKKVAKKANN